MCAELLPTGAWLTSHGCGWALAFNRWGFTLPYSLHGGERNSELLCPSLFGLGVTQPLLCWVCTWEMGQQPPACIQKQIKKKKTKQKTKKQNGFSWPDASPCKVGRWGGRCTTSLFVHLCFSPAWNFTSSVSSTPSRCYPQLCLSSALSTRGFPLPGPPVLYFFFPLICSLAQTWTVSAILARFPTANSPWLYLRHVVSIFLKY